MSRAEVLRQARLLQTVVDTSRGNKMLNTRKQKHHTSGSIPAPQTRRWSFSSKYLALLVLATAQMCLAANPVLLVGTSSNQFSLYYSEILKAEGLNAFDTADISTVTATTLNTYDLVILGTTPLTPTQVSMFSTWVSAGGNLIAMRPDKQLATLLGISDASATISNGYLLVNTATSAGNGIVGQTIQFHDAADLYTLSGATTIATLYTTATSATTNPAVTLRTAIGSGGGSAAAFTYDLARSIVYTRQGNPAWAAQERDGTTPIRSNDMFYGNASFDPKPDWVDLNKIQIPQADEQQRLLANLILLMNQNKKPLPRLWYLPFGKKAALVMTGDDHATGGTAPRFDGFIFGQPGRLQRGQLGMRPRHLLHVPRQSHDGRPGGFLQFARLRTGPAPHHQLRRFLRFFQPGFVLHRAAQHLEQPVSQRARPRHQPHPLRRLERLGQRSRWSKWLTASGWTPITTTGRPPGPTRRSGHFTGSGMPMRFARLDGTIIDVYQANTQIPDETLQNEPTTINTLLDNALGATGYYAVVTTNMHTDSTATQSAAWATATGVFGAEPGRPRGHRQADADLARWPQQYRLQRDHLERHGAHTLVRHLSGQRLERYASHAPGFDSGGSLTTLTLGGSALSFTLQTIKGIQYAVFSATAGSYVATYGGVSVTVTPDSASLSASQAQQFTATVAGSTNTNVTWSSSNSSLGTLTAGGLYTAPNTIATTQTITITATSVANTSKSDSAIVTLLSNSTPPTITNIVATPSTTSAVITWTTNKNTNSRVDYGISSSNLNLNAINASLVTSHSISLSSLAVADHVLLPRHLGRHLQHGHQPDRPEFAELHHGRHRVAGDFRADRGTRPRRHRNRYVDHQYRHQFASGLWHHVRFVELERSQRHAGYLAQPAVDRPDPRHHLLFPCDLG